MRMEGGNQVSGISINFKNIVQKENVSGYTYGSFESD